MVTGIAESVMGNLLQRNRVGASANLIEGEINKPAHSPTPVSYSQPYFGLVAGRGLERKAASRGQY